MSTLTLSTIRHNLSKFDLSGLSIPVVVLVIMAMLCWSVLDACNKQLMAQGLVPKQVLFLQASIVLCMLMPVWVATKGRVVRSRKPLIHVLRAGFIVTSAWCAAYAVSHLPLAEASAFLMTGSLFMLPLGVFFLGEKPHWLRWTWPTSHWPMPRCARP